MATIVFIDQSFAFDGSTIHTSPLGGIRSATIQLAEAFAARGHQVKVYNLCEKNLCYNDVEWIPLNQCPASAADLVIANSDPNHLGKATSGKYVVWLHNKISIEKFVRRRRIFPLLRFRPEAVFLGPFHASTCHWLIPFSGRKIIPHGLGEPFISAPTASTPPKPRAIYTSTPSGGLDAVLKLWLSHIHPAVPDAVLHVFASNETIGGLPSNAAKDHGVIVHSRVRKALLAEELRRSRVMLYPGHRHETFCFAAAEAISMGVPVVTRGFGSLVERVQDGVTGFVSPDDQSFAAAAVALLTDDALWRRQHAEALKVRQTASTWDDRAAEWEQAFLG